MIVPTGNKLDETPAGSYVMKSAPSFKKRILRSQAAPSAIKTTSNLTFPSGSDDIVLTILRLCDVFTVLSMSWVSKRLHNLAFSREVWFALISDLHARSFINYVPGQRRIQDLTVEELVDLAKRTVQGPRSFSTRESSGPVIAHQIFLNPSLPPGVQSLSLRSITPLPGGRFVLLRDWNGMRCWSVQDDRLFWEYQGHWKYRPVVAECDVEVIEGGEVAMIALAVVIVLEGTHTPLQFADIVRLDLVHGTSFSVFLHLVKESERDPHSHFLIKIRGDFAIVQVGYNYHEELTLLQLSTQSSRSYSMAEFNYKAVLIPGYVVLANCKKSSNSLYFKIFLHVWNIDSLMMHPTQGPELKAPSLIHQSIKLPLNRRFPGFYLSAHASPLQREHYTLWMAFIGMPHIARTTVNKFELSLHALRSQKPSLEQRLYGTYELPGTWHGRDMRIAYSGRTLCSISLDSYKICSLTKAPETTRTKRPLTQDKRQGKHEFLAIDLPPIDGHESVHLSDYGGTMTFRQRNQIVIHFYD